jgi:hypothetical protein
MTRAELLLWPAANNWGWQLRNLLTQHLILYTTLYPDERTCDIWAEVVDRGRKPGLQDPNGRRLDRINRETVGPPVSDH